MRPSCIVAALHAGHITCWPYCMLARLHAGRIASGPYYSWPHCMLAVLHVGRIASGPYCRVVILHRGHIAQQPYCIEAILHSSHIVSWPYCTGTVSSSGAGEVGRRDQVEQIEKGSASSAQHHREDGPASWLGVRAWARSSVRWRFRMGGRGAGASGLSQTHHS